jgi:hypothetical protein
MQIQKDTTQLAKCKITWRTSASKHTATIAVNIGYISDILPQESASQILHMHLEIQNLPRLDRTTLVPV